jgi:hypothetical protein
MCPACLASLAITVATTTGAGAAVTAFAVRVTRSWTKDPKPQNPEGDVPHERIEAHRQP